jgi:nucleoside phosphorylase
MFRSIDPKIGIITALPVEFAAMKVLLNQTNSYILNGKGGGHRYLIGNVSSSNIDDAPVILLLTEMGNNIAATRATQLLSFFSTISSIIMVGIAGGVPNPQKPEDHVRLGDIVVSDHRGVIQYDFGKEKVEEMIFRFSPRPPSPSLLEAVRFLKAGEYESQLPWMEYIDLAMSQLRIGRPSNEKDLLYDSRDTHKLVQHPADSNRFEGQPKIFLGPIASANIVLSNPIKRDYLRDKFGVKAIEMEGSGIADATWNHEVGYLVVKGICDYCDEHKNDDWQEYAAVAAAAYTRALLEIILYPSAKTESTERKYNLATLRKLILVGFSEQEIREIITDYFPEAESGLGGDMPFREIVGILLSYCKRNNQIEELLTYIKKKNPRRYEEFAPELVDKS